MTRFFEDSQARKFKKIYIESNFKVLWLSIDEIVLIR